MGNSSSNLFAAVVRSAGEQDPVWEDGYVAVGVPVDPGGSDPETIQLRELGQFVGSSVQAGDQKEQPHTCIAGDTLEGLSLKYGTTAALLKKRNKLVSSTLFPGRIIIVPIPSEEGPNETVESSQSWAKARAMVPADEDMFDTAAMWDGSTGFASLRQDYTPLSEDRQALSKGVCTWVGGVFRPPGDCFVTRFSLHLRLVCGEVLRFRLILAEWIEDSKNNGGRPGGVLHCSQTMELRKGAQGANSNGYVRFELVVPDEGGMGGVKKGMSVILAASTEGLTCEGTAEAHVGCMPKLVVGAVLNKTVWLNGRVGDKESDDDVVFESGDSTLAVCVQMMSVARMLRGGLSIPTRRRTTQKLSINGEGLVAEPEGGAVAALPPPLDEAVNSAATPEEQSPRQMSPVSEPETHSQAHAAVEEEQVPAVWDEALLEDLPMFLSRDDDGILRGVASDVLGQGPGDLIRIHASLPPRCRVRDWELLYSTRRSGLSINTFFRCVSGRQDTVLVCRDATGHTFGMFQGFPWRQQRDFYGRGESFVFTVRPEFVKYPWTRTNSMFALTNSSGLLFGGGFKAAIWLDQDFNHGASGYCPTWGNPTLSGSESFTCVHLEIWGMWHDGEEEWKISSERARLWSEMGRGQGWSDELPNKAAQ